jgi:hypothetical protein
VDEEGGREDDGGRGGRGREEKKRKGKNHHCFLLHLCPRAPYSTEERKEVREERGRKNYYCFISAPSAVFHWLSLEWISVQSVQPPWKSASISSSHSLHFAFSLYL